ncbi:MAG: hypothetical protein AAGD14_12175 [Planctomycetota bacterium]
MIRILPLALLLACQSTPIPTPAGPEVGVIHVRFSISGGRSGTTSPQLQRAFFAKLKEGSDDIRQSTEIIPSNYQLGTAAYLLNAAPGRYVVVCAVTNYEGKNHFVYLPGDVIEASIVEVRPGSIVPVGSIRVSESRAWSTADELQQHFHQRILSGPQNPNVLQQLFPKAIDHMGEYGKLSNDPKDLERTRRDVRRSLNRWGWSNWPGSS